MPRVLLVDGVGNAVVYEATHDVLTLTLPSTRQSFLKSQELFDDLPIYRLRGAGTPAIRFPINRYIVERN